MAQERSSKRASKLRKRAEKILAEDPQAIQPMVPADIQKLIHELNVHQIELEMQNEELRRVQLELQEARDKYRNLYDFAPTGYFTLDRNSLIVDVNLAGSELLGSEKHRLIGTQFTSSISPDSQDAFYFHCREVLKTGIKGNCEIKMLKADGTPFHAQVISVAVPEKDGNINHFRTAVIDITALKKADEEITRLNKDLERRVVQLSGLNRELERSNRDLEQFAYVASHDLQEPLRMVSSFTQLLEQRYKGKIDKSADEFIKFAVDGANYMQRMINDLLSYSRLSTRGTPFEPVNSEEILAQVQVNLLLLIEENRALLTHESLPEITADASQMLHLFQNLIGNAIKFRGKEPPRVHVFSESREEEWMFGVRDNGIGIAKEYFDRIFVIFQRLYSREEYSGTGIGLSICKKIVERHGGRIWVESEPDKGSTFFFTIPKRRE